jgi:hypothetical protein
VLGGRSRRAESVEIGDLRSMLPRCQVARRLVASGGAMGGIGTVVSGGRPKALCRSIHVCWVQTPVGLVVPVWMTFIDK